MLLLLMTLLLLASCSDDGSLAHENTRFYSDEDTSAFKMEYDRKNDNKKEEKRRGQYP